MTKLILLFGLLLCAVVVNARHFGDINNGDALENEEDTLRRSKEHVTQARHRKRRWQMSYGYDYPPLSYQYPDRRNYDRRDYDRSSQELQHITRLLEEISAYIRQPQSPPPPPQPIYIPYPMYINYPLLPSVPCKTPNTTGVGGNIPNLDKRINLKEMDPNQNWGFVVSNDNQYDDGSDGSRPLSFTPIVPKQFMKRPAPRVEHGSVQASVQAQQVTTQAPKFESSASESVAVPGMCNAAILSCCGMSKDQQEKCFASVGCSASFDNGSVCSSDSIQKAIDSFRMAYSPLN